MRRRWYHGLLSRATAAERLQEQAPGSFLCAFSEEQSVLVVSAVMAGGAVQHFELRAQLPKGYKDATGGVYDTVAEYIQRTVPQSTPGAARADRGSK